MEINFLHDFENIDFPESMIQAAFKGIVKAFLDKFIELADKDSIRNLSFFQLFWNSYLISNYKIIKLCIDEIGTDEYDRRILHDKSEKVKQDLEKLKKCENFQNPLTPSRSLEFKKIFENNIEGDIFLEELNSFLVNLTVQGSDVPLCYKKNIEDKLFDFTIKYFIFFSFENSTEKDEVKKILNDNGIHNFELKMRPLVNGQNPEIVNQRYNIYFAPPLEDDYETMRDKTIKHLIRSTIIPTDIFSKAKDSYEYSLTYVPFFRVTGSFGGENCYINVKSSSKNEKGEKTYTNDKIDVPEEPFKTLFLGTDLNKFLHINHKKIGSFKGKIYSFYKTSKLSKIVFIDKHLDPILKKWISEPLQIFAEGIENNESETMLPMESFSKFDETKEYFKAPIDIIEPTQKKINNRFNDKTSSFKHTLVKRSNLNQEHIVSKKYNAPPKLKNKDISVVYHPFVRIGYSYNGSECLIFMDKKGQQCINPKTTHRDLVPLIFRYSIISSILLSYFFICNWYFELFNLSSRFAIALVASVVISLLSYTLILIYRLERLNNFKKEYGYEPLTVRDII